MSSPAPRILIVEDEPSTRESLAVILGDEGYRCLSAADGKLALRLLDEEAIDLVLLDLMTPHTGAADLFSSLRECRPDVPILLLSFYEDRERLAEVLGRGASGYLFKPIDFDELLERIPSFLC